jgi:hypothetical protein
VIDNDNNFVNSELQLRGSSVVFLGTLSAYAAWQAPRARAVCTSYVRPTPPSLSATRKCPTLAPSADKPQRNNGNSSRGIHSGFVVRPRSSCTLAI